MIEFIIKQGYAIDESALEHEDSEELSGDDLFDVAGERSSEIRSRCRIATQRKVTLLKIYKIFIFYIFYFKLIEEEIKMSKENVNKFFEELKSNSDLSEQFETLVTNLNNLSNDEKKEKLVEFITKQGYDFDVNELKDYILSKGSNDVSEDELANVAGGDELDEMCGMAAKGGVKIFKLLI